MEDLDIKEILNYKLNNIEQNLEVTFRTLKDDEDEQREDKIPFEEMDNFGFGNLKDMNNLDLDDDFDLFDFENEYDDYDMIEFLNEYYLIFPERLPEVKIN